MNNINNMNNMHNMNINKENKAKTLEQMQKELNESECIQKFRKYAQTLKYPMDSKVLFIDGGSNIGQGYNFFAKELVPRVPQLKFALFEPNPNCVRQLILKYAVGMGDSNGNKGENVHEINNVGLYTKTTELWMKFDESYDLGGSIIHEHNSNFKKQPNRVLVNCVDIADYICDKLRMEFDRIILKLDVESAEYDILEHLITTGVIHKIDFLIIEWHDQYMTEEHYNFYVQRRMKIVKYMNDHNIKWFEWV